jgi:hypothetical protein
MRDGKLTRNRLTKRRLRWLLGQDPLVSYFWLRVNVNDWRVPSDPERLFLMSGVLY